MVESSEVNVNKELLLWLEPDEILQFTTVFKSIDKDKDWFIDAKELLTAFHCLGFRDMKEEDANKLIVEVDLNKNNKLETNEFFLLMNRFKKSGMKDKFKSFVDSKWQT